jgi:dihydroorotate dehydrogenase electron transfer subunit
MEDIQFEVSECIELSVGSYVVILEAEDTLPKIKPGQFIMLRIKNQSVFLRRPFAILDVDYKRREISLSVIVRGHASFGLTKYNRGDELMGTLPLGNGFTMPGKKVNRILLAGGGSGAAPLYFLAQEVAKLKRKNKIHIDLLVGAKEYEDILPPDDFKEIATVHIASEEDDRWFKGLMTEHPVLEEQFDCVYGCGSRGMLQALGARVKDKVPFVEFSIENKMACGVGVCLCCTEKLKDGTNARVCKEGPVFNIKDLSWIA